MHNGVIWATFLIFSGLTIAISIVYPAVLPTESALGFPSGAAYPYIPSFQKKKRYLSLLSLSSIMGQSRFAVLARSHERVLLCIFYCGGKERYWYILSHGTSPSSQTHKYT